MSDDLSKVTINLNDDGTSPPDPVTEALEAARARQQASRRGLVQAEPRHSDPAKPAIARKKKSKFGWPVLAAIVLLMVAGVAIVALQVRQDGSDLGTVRRYLMSWEFARDPATRDHEVLPIDQMGAKGFQLAVSLLADTQKAEIGSSHSDTTVQQLSAAYLMHVASMVKLDPPPLAVEVKGNLFEGVPPTAAKWADLQKAWTTWLSEAQSKGVLKG